MPFKLSRMHTFTCRRRLKWAACIHSHVHVRWNVLQCLHWNAVLPPKPKIFFYFSLDADDVNVFDIHVRERKIKIITNNINDVKHITLIQIYLFIWFLYKTIFSLDYWLLHSHVLICWLDANVIFTCMYFHVFTLKKKIYYKCTSQ